MLTSFTKNNEIACLNLKEDNLKFIFKSRLCCILKILFEGEKKKKEEICRCYESFFNLLLNI